MLHDDGPFARALRNEDAAIPGDQQARLQGGAGLDLAADDDEPSFVVGAVVTGEEGAEVGDADSGGVADAVEGGGGSEVLEPGSSGADRKGNAEESAVARGGDASEGGCGVVVPGHLRPALCGTRGGTDSAGFYPPPVRRDS